MKTRFIVFLFLICFKFQAQELISSNTTIESCNDQQNCLKVPNFSLLYYDEATTQFYLRLNFGAFRLGADTNDNWLNQVKDTMFYFRAIMPPEQFPSVGNQSTKSLRLKGQIFYGGIWKDVSVDMQIVANDNSILNTTDTKTNLQYDNFKVTFSIPFVPKDFKNYRNIYYNNQTLSIAVTMGRINLLRPGMEFLLDGAYYQASR